MVFLIVKKPFRQNKLNEIFQQFKLSVYASINSTPYCLEGAWIAMFFSKKSEKWRIFSNQVGFTANTQTYFIAHVKALVFCPEGFSATFSINCSVWRHGDVKDLPTSKTLFALSCHCGRGQKHIQTHKTVGVCRGIPVRSQSALLRIRSKHRWDLGG